MSIAKAKSNQRVQFLKAVLCCSSGITKLLTKLGKQEDLAVINKWIKSCKRHLYWSATTTFDENDDMILAKFKVFLSHVVNEHENLDNALFNRCRHGQNIGIKNWIQKGIYRNHDSGRSLVNFLYMESPPNLCFIQYIWVPTLLDI